ncbi:MAG TPA: ribonuclease HII [Anaerolineales bacterium]|jgi:ribonuclease HII|nr:ribonuclease HII [Anaerolineales bacterium]
MLHDPRPDLRYEEQLRGDGARYVAGLDEVGRGAWAGPVMAAAVILPLDCPDLSDRLEGVRDSKAMTVQQRERWDDRIRRVSLSIGVGSASSQEVDAAGLIEATRRAMRRALADLSLIPDHLLIDHISLPTTILPQTPLTHGDSIALSIAASSIIAKVARDAVMRHMSYAYPGYGFEYHVGYGTPRHRQALQRLGACPIHRRSYTPLKALVTHSL